MDLLLTKCEFVLLDTVQIAFCMAQTQYFVAVGLCRLSPQLYAFRLISCRAVLV